MGYTASVVVITLNRPDYVRRCLECLESQDPCPNQIIVVDASKDDLTEKVVCHFPAVLYLRNATGFGRMTTSRNIALKHVTGDIIAFVDDDAFVHPGWLNNLLATYTDDSIGAVGGRALNNQPGEATQGVNEIGKLKSNGDIAGNFAADPGEIIPVDHIMGCNMSFRREVLAQLGGFREDYPGISGVCEDSDMSLRVHRLRYKILFNPAAVVDHVAAPQAVGRRFDTRYAFNAQRNRIVMLICNFGLSSPYVRRYMLASMVRDLTNIAKQIYHTVSVFLANFLGIFVGLTLGVRLRLRTRGNPVRDTPDAAEITHWLSKETAQNALSLDETKQVASRLSSGEANT